MSGILISLIVINTLSAIFIVNYLIDSANVVNYSGTQRYRTEMVGYLIVRVNNYDISTDSKDHGELLSDLRSTIDILENNHHALIQGDKIRDIPKPPNSIKEIYFGSQYNLNATMHSYIEISRETLVNFENGLQVSNETLLTISSISEELIDLLNILTEEFENVFEERLIYLLILQILLILFSCFSYYYTYKLIHRQAELLKQRSNDLIKHSKLGIVLLVDGEIKMINDQLINMFGFDDSSELMDQSFFDFVSDADRTVIIDRNNIRRKNNQVSDSFKIELQNKALNPIPVELFIQDIELNKEDIGELIFFKDLTELKDIEKQLKESRKQVVNYQKLEIMSKLSGGIAHDFNNLLQVIIGFNELALETVDKESMLYELLMEIKKATEKASNLTNNLLTLSNKKRVDMRYIEINNQILEISKMVKSILSEGIIFETNITSKNCFVHIDPTLFGQIILNLCINAREAMHEEGKITISTEIIENNQGFEEVQIIVSDTGEGIPKDILHHIFDPFFTTKSEGTGLGMTIVKSLIAEFGGRIEIKSEYGIGTQISLYFPLISEGKIHQVNEILEDDN